MSLARQSFGNLQGYSVEEFLLGRFGGYTVMLAVMAVIVVFLRVLFGPRGLLREPGWHTSAQARMADEPTPGETIPGSPTPKSAGKPDWDAHLARFLDFTAPYITGTDDAPLRLKVEHSLRVFEHARLLAEEDDVLAPEARRAAILAALYHDCGRFPQFRRYRTFADGLSANHARLGLGVVKNERFLSDESRPVRLLAQSGILLHNKYALPPALLPDARRVTDIVRDADKLDILRVMVEHLGGALPEKDAVLLSVRDEPDKWSATVLRDVMEGRVARYADLRYVNDFRLLLGTWLHEIRFAATRRVLRESGLMERVLADLPPEPKIREAAALLHGLLDRL